MNLPRTVQVASIRQGATDRSTRLRTTVSVFTLCFVGSMVSAVAGHEPSEIRVVDTLPRDVSQRFVLPQVDEVTRDLVTALTEQLSAEQWERAFPLFDRLRERRPVGMVWDTERGWTPIDVRLQSILLSLPEPGLRAFRLFYDAEADSLLETAASRLPDATRTGERRALREICTYLAFSSAAPRAADRWGDLEFEAGHFASSVRAWQLAQRMDRLGAEHAPESDATAVAEVQRDAKILLAARYGRDAMLERDVSQRLLSMDGDTRVRHGGVSWPVQRWMKSMDGVPDETVSSIARPTGSLPLSPTALAATIGWRSRLPVDATALRQAGNPRGGQLLRVVNGRATAVGEPAMEPDDALSHLPSVQCADERILVNPGSSVLCLSWRDGATQWTASQVMPPMDGSMTNPTRIQPAVSQRIAPHGLGIFQDALWCTVRGMDAAAHRSQLVGVDPIRGDVQFRSRIVTERSDFELQGDPVVTSESIYSLASIRDRPNDLEIIAIDRRDNALAWRSRIGSYASSHPQQRNPGAHLCLVEDRLVVDTQTGVLLSIDRERGELYAAHVLLAGPSATAESPVGDRYASPVLTCRDRLILKPAGARRVVAWDTHRDSIAWTAPAFASSRLAAVDARHLVTGGPELTLYDTPTGRMRWTADLGAAPCWPALTEHHVYAMVDGQLLAFDRTTGEPQRRWEIDMPRTGSRVIAGMEGILIVTSTEVVALLTHPAEAPSS